MKQKHIIIIISSALVLASLVFYSSARSFSKQSSYIEVKGLSEKIVKSDIAVWSLSFQVKSNSVDSLYSETESNISKISSFLIKEGFSQDEFNVSPLNIYQNTYQNAIYRYDTNVNVSVYTDNVDLVRKSSERVGSLIKDGLIINSNHIDFQFTGLNKIKPEMLAEAVVNAKKSAEEFAQNSGSSVGSIVRANQGVFSITQKDPGSPEYKKVRVVSTLRYLLR